MATDIWIHVEYQKKVKKNYKYVFVPEFSDDGDRLYGLFSIMAGICWDYGVLYPVRGFPIDASPEVAKKYYGDESFHHASWLSTEEFNACLACYREKLEQKDYTATEIDEILENYMRIYKYMQNSEDDGDPARIVFWFDN